MDRTEWIGFIIAGLLLAVGGSAVLILVLDAIKHPCP